MKRMRHVGGFIAIVFYGVALLASATSTANANTSAPSKGVANRFVFVNFDASSAATLGEFPSRAVTARVLAKINLAKPKAVALKFFYDSEGVLADTELIRAEIAQGRVLMQATINAEPPTTKFLDTRFYFDGLAAGVMPEIIGDKGWLPIPALTAKA